MNVFPHWQDRAACLEEAGRVLNTGGVFLLVKQPRSDRLEQGLAALQDELQTALRAGRFRVLRTEIHRVEGKPVLAVFASNMAPSWTAEPAPEVTLQLSGSSHLH